MVSWREHLIPERTEALLGIRPQVNSSGNELSSVHPEMVQKGPAHLGGQRVRQNGL